MAVKVNSDGSFQITYQGPWTGLHVEAPENLIPDTAFPQISNFMLRNAELRSRINFILEFQAPTRNEQVLGTDSFMDANGTVHTVLYTTRGLWQLKGNAQLLAQNAWQFLGGPALSEGNPIISRAFANVLYYCDGGTFLASWDGISASPVASVATVSEADASQVISGATGPLSIGGYYLGELDDHLFLANVNVLDQGTGESYNFPQRMWWSADGIPNVWDPIANTNAGYNDFLDCPDQLSGTMTIGIAGFLFRSNGITQFTPTGNGITPFDFDHLWASDQGVGNVYNWSIAQYGPTGYFIATDNVYSMSVNSFTPIGGTARDAIYADLANASAAPVASYLPTFYLGYNYPVYMISIPLTTFTRNYVYSVEDNNWSVWDVSGMAIGGIPCECWLGQAAPATTVGVVPQSSSSGSSGGSGGGANSGGGIVPPGSGSGKNGRPLP